MRSNGSVTSYYRRKKSYQEGKCPSSILWRLHVLIQLKAGAPTRTRTADLLITNQLLYQLSYRGIPDESQEAISYITFLDLSSLSIRFKH